MPRFPLRKCAIATVVIAFCGLTSEVSLASYECETIPNKERRQSICMRSVVFNQSRLDKARAVTPLSLRLRSVPSVMPRES